MRIKMTVAEALEKLEANSYDNNLDKFEEIVYEDFGFSDGDEIELVGRVVEGLDEDGDEETSLEIETVECSVSGFSIQYRGFIDVD